jgi:uncharacterized SAM-binding protein YcdF (DUF218 family)
MSPVSARMRTAVRRTAWTLLLILILTAALSLPFAGRWLVYEDPIAHADAIFVLAGARAERWLEAVDLFQRGVAPLIVLSPGRPEDAERVLRERGVRLPGEADLARDAMQQLGVPAAAIRILPGAVDNTAEEAAALHAAVRSSHWRSLIVVTSKYHSRRAAFAFDREFAGTGVVIMVHATRYDTSDPAHWWRHRADIRFVTSELQKLVAYRVIGGTP